MTANTLYSFLSGPCLWVSAAVFFIGLFGRICILYGKSRSQDRIFYNHKSFSWGAKSILIWLIPWGSASLRRQPVFSLAAFVFHVALILVPLFLYAHNALFHEAFGISLPALPGGVADGLTVALVAAGVFLFVRRLLRPEVRILTEIRDYVFLLLTMAPFVTGFLAYHQWGPYEWMMVAHVFFGNLLLVLIPFTKLGHMALYFLTRAFIGFEMGGRRGARAW